MEINFIFTINLLIIFNELSLKQIYGKKDFYGRWDPDFKQKINMP